MLIFKKISTTTYRAWDGRDFYEIIREPGKPYWGGFKNKYWMLVARFSMAEAKAACEEERRLQRFYSRNLRTEKIRAIFLQIYVATGLKIFYNGEIESRPEDAKRLRLGLHLRRVALEAIKAKEATMAKTNKSAASAPATAANTAGATAVAEKEPKVKAPPKPRIGMTEEELAAAVEGSLKPRDTKGGEDQEALSTRDENDRPKGRPIGVLTGLPILGAWCFAFQENAKSPGLVHSSVKGLLGRKPDSAITEYMNREFPGRNTPAFAHPQSCRNDYNNGKFTRLTKPKTMSTPYNEKGEQIEPTKRGQKEAEAAATPAAAAAPAAPAKKK